MRFDSNFLENAWELIAGPLEEFNSSAMFQTVFKMVWILKGGSGS